MALIVAGLGNPGPEFADTRHNAGFKVVDLLAENLRASYWKDEAGAKTSTIRFDDDDLVLAKPQSFMNISGKAVVKLLQTYEVPVESLIVVHDDIDLPPGSVRAKRDGGHGGHNGLRSITEETGHDDFLRVRVGVGRPPGRMDPSDYVLQPMRGDTLADFDSVVPSAAQAVMHILEHGIESAMQEFNAD
ncbi:MAG: aminoacyl-tRNA hydrolase [Coriobacteriia bacterium]|nr:aminoacyl-tRNA hydrolase [Coriobacteriia bacterium]